MCRAAQPQESSQCGLYYLPGPANRNLRQLVRLLYYATFISFTGTYRREVEQHINICGKIFEGYSTRLQAEHAWLVGNTVGAVHQLDAACTALATPAAPYPEDVMHFFLGLPDDYLGTEWHVLSKGKHPGVYPCWYVPLNNQAHT